jgi:hypothetical protein
VCGQPIAAIVGSSQLACGACQVIHTREVLGQWSAHATSAAALPATRALGGLSLKVQGRRVGSKWLRGADLGPRVVIGWRRRLHLVLMWGILMLSVGVELLNELNDYLYWYGTDEWEPAFGFEIFVVAFGVIVLLAYPMLKAGLSQNTITLVNGRVELERPRWPVPRLGGLRRLAAAYEHLGRIQPEDVRLWCDPHGEDGSASYGITVRDAEGRSHRLIEGVDLAEGRFLFSTVVGHLSQWPDEVARAPRA